MGDLIGCGLTWVVILDELLALLVRPDLDLPGGVEDPPLDLDSSKEIRELAEVARLLRPTRTFPSKYLRPARSPGCAAVVA